MVATRRRCTLAYASPGCSEMTDLFFSDDVQSIELAQEICAGCRLSGRCLERALARREAAGVWGGQLMRDGQMVPTVRSRGRPRKTVAA